MNTQTETADISIIVPVYNTGAIMRETIDSILAQVEWEGNKVPTYEVLMVDDHSTDKVTVDLLAEFEKLGTNFNVIKNIKTKGVSGARNTGIEKASGKWVAFLDSDDVLLPHSLAMKWAYIEKTENVTWLATPFFLLKPETGIEHTPFPQRSPLLYDVIKEQYDQNLPSVLITPIKLLCRNCILGTLTVLVKRDVLVSVGGFSEHLKRAEDYELWFKLSLNNDLHYLPHDTGAYRLRPGSLTRSNEPMFFYEDIMLQGLLAKDEFKPFRNILIKRLHFVLLDYCYYYRQSGTYKQKCYWAVQFVKSFPLSIKSWQMLVASIFNL